MKKNKFRLKSGFSVIFPILLLFCRGLYSLDCRPEDIKIALEEYYAAADGAVLSDPEIFDFPADGIVKNNRDPCISALFGGFVEIGFLSASKNEDGKTIYALTDKGAGKYRKNFFYRKNVGVLSGFVFGKVITRDYIIISPIRKIGMTYQVEVEYKFSAGAEWWMVETIYPLLRCFNDAGYMKESVGRFLTSIAEPQTDSAVLLFVQGKWIHSELYESEKYFAAGEK
jgi:hypothetical protein